MLAVGHGAKDGAVAADFEGAIVPRQHESVVLLLRRFEEAINVFHQDIHGFLVQRVDRVVDVLLAWGEGGERWEWEWRR